MAIPVARRIRHIVVAAIIGLLVLVTLWPQPRPVDTAVVDRGAVRETVEAEGRTRLRYRYDIAAPVAAIARRLTLEPGDAIEAGQPLVVLDAVAAPTLDARTRAEAEARRDAARARLAAVRETARAAQTAATQARSEASRLARLVEQRLVAEELAERADATAQRAERDAESARFMQATAAHELQAAEAALTRGNADPQQALVLTAPVAGMVVRRHYESARPVQAGEALLEIGDPAQLEVEVDVLSADAVRLREGTRTELLRWGEGRPLLAEVRRVEPGGFTKFSALGVEEQRVWVILDIISPREEWARLGDAYRVNARFVLREVQDVVRAPASAVFPHGDGSAVFRLDGSRARLTPVRVGVRGSATVEILEGLEPDTEVIVHPDRELQDGARVEPR